MRFLSCWAFAIVVTISIGLLGDALVFSQAQAANVNVQVSAQVPSTAQLSISDESIDFGEVTPEIVRFATTDGGSLSEVPAYSITVSSNDSVGFTLTLEGLPPQAGSEMINPIGGTPIELQAGAETYGMRLQTASGPGDVASPYDGAGYAFETDATQTLLQTSGPLNQTVYDAYHGATVSTFTVPAEYKATNHFSLVSSF